MYYTQRGNFGNARGLRLTTRPQSLILARTLRLLGDRIMVVQRTLTPSVEVRILVPQPLQFIQIVTFSS